MKKIKLTLTLFATIFCNINLAHTFACSDLIRRFGPNSYITRIPLYFKTVQKSKTKKLRAHRERRAMNNKMSTNKL